LYTLLNVQSTNEISAICAEVSDDSALLAVGFSDSLIRIWPLSKNNKLRSLKAATDLENLDKDADDVFLKMMEDQQLDIKVFHGHSGPVYGLSFSPCKDLLLSGSEDSTSKYKCNCSLLMKLFIICVSTLMEFAYLDQRGCLQRPLFSCVGCQV